MADPASIAEVTAGVALLERAVGYTLGSLNEVPASSLSASTPCAGWDLHDLLAHMDDSLQALEEAVEGGEVALTPALVPDLGSSDVVGALKSRACRMLGAWTGAGVHEAATIGGCTVPTSVVISTGAVEVAVHGWDVAQACGVARPIPDALAAELIPWARVLVSPEDRPVRFGRPVASAPHAGAGSRLLAYLGRTA